MLPFFEAQTVITNAHKHAVILSSIGFPAITQIIFTHHLFQKKLDKWALLHRNLPMKMHNLKANTVHILVFVCRNNPSIQKSRICGKTGVFETKGVFSTNSSVHYIAAAGRSRMDFARLARSVRNRFRMRNSASSAVNLASKRPLEQQLIYPSQSIKIA
jgi:hypothetical protein